MNKGKVRNLIVALGLLVILGGVGPQESSAQTSARLIREIRHELATLPYYGVFDWLEFEVQRDNT
ncbi:MAG TPA: hypothetical protein VF074_17975 [Pyrinomonadaceae bacterium]